MHFLFATWDGGGNVPPTLALARQLLGRGHSVRVLGPPSLRLRFEGAGCVFDAYERVPNGIPSAAGKSGMGRVRAALLVMELARAAPALGFGENVLGELERVPVDALVVDFMLAGAVAAAERAGLPTAALMHTVYCLPAPGRPPFGPGFKPREGPAVRLRDAAVLGLRRGANRRALTDLNDARRQIGLAPVGSASDQLARVARVLVLTSAAFDPPPAALPPNVRYVGPPLDDSSPGRLDLSWPGRDREPLVVVSFSTRFAAVRLGQRVLDALGMLRVRGLLTLGPALAHEDLRVPPNVLVRTFLPHRMVLPSAQLVITHAGLGTVMGALAHGVPLLCLPLKNDQFENAARVVSAGAGCRLGSRASRSSLRQTILRLLDDPHFRERAGRMAKAVSAHEGQAVHELEALSGPHERPAEPLGFPEERSAAAGR
jgi:MGT family glycosyltransferase